MCHGMALPEYVSGNCMLPEYVMSGNCMLPEYVVSGNCFVLEYVSGNGVT